MKSLQNQAEISIAMATYNGGKYIQEQLDSFLNQSLLPNELIICDDGSIDNTINIIKKFKKKAPFDILLYKNEYRMGYGQNFGKALSLCNGDLIFLSDQDDVWFPNKIEKISQVAKSNPNYYLIMNDATITDENLVDTNLTKLDQIKSSGYKQDSFIQGSCATIKKELLYFILPIHKQFIDHDSWIVELANLFDVKYIINQSLQYYRIHTKNTSDYFANQTNKVSFYSSTLNRIHKISTNKQNSFLTVGINKLLYMEERIQHVADEFPNNPIVFNGKIIMAFKKIKKSKNAHAQRIRLKTKPFYQRLLLAINMYKKGIYQNHFNGIQSLLRDVIFK